jgi:DNA-binding NarL/FixJ family response regulator
MPVIEAGSPPASSPIPSRVAVYHPLTHREAQVYALLDQGLKDREIALQLQISVRTVEKHVENILRKLRARSRQEAVYRRPPLP